CDDAAGAAMGHEPRITTYPGSAKSGPAIAMNASGEFVVVWSGNEDVKPRIWAQRYSSAGFQVGGEFRVDAGQYYAGTSPRVKFGSGGRFAVVWTQYTFGTDLAQVFSSSFS